MSRALLSFTVRHVGIRLRVRVLSTAKEVNEAYRKAPGKCQPYTRGLVVMSFFQAIRSPLSKYSGVITLLASPKLFEYVPHEVSHAVIEHFDTVTPEDDEEFATAVGVLSSKIFAKVKCYV